MTTVCIQCAMKALVGGGQIEVFDETPEQHLARCHPDLTEAQRERAFLERKLIKEHKHD